VPAGCDIWVGGRACGGATVERLVFVNERIASHVHAEGAIDVCAGHLAEHLDGHLLWHTAHVVSYHAAMDDTRKDVTDRDRWYTQMDRARQALLREALGFPRRRATDAEVDAARDWLVSKTYEVNRQRVLAAFARGVAATEALKLFDGGGSAKFIDGGYTGHARGRAARWEEKWFYEIVPLTDHHRSTVHMVLPQATEDPTIGIAFPEVVARGFMGERQVRRALCSLVGRGMARITYVERDSGKPIRRIHLWDRGGHHRDWERRVESRPIPLFSSFETRWMDVRPEDAGDLDLSVRFDISAPHNEQGERCPWPWEPQQLGGAPLGQMHCSYCGAMCVAGIPHFDYGASGA
jgi:hypothetical protein